MRYLITGDWHINLRKNTNWEINRYQQLKQHFIDVANTYDNIILAGDIFDLPNPNLQEISLFYDFIKTLNDLEKKVYLIDGNHERVDNKTTTFDFLPNVDFTYVMNGIIKHKHHTLYLISHSKLNTIKDYEVSDKYNILISHFRSSLGFIKQETDVGYISKTFDYTIAGDIHTHYFPYKNVEYTSQPFNTHYDMKKDNGYIILDLSKKSPSISYKKLNLPNKFKLELSADEYKEFYPSLNDVDLFKIVILDTADKVKDLPSKGNILLTYKPTTFVSEESIEEIKEEIKSKGFIDIISVLKRLVIESEQVLPEQIVLGENLLDLIDKELL